MAPSEYLAHSYNRRQVVPIEVLPDDVLLAIFDSYVFQDKETGYFGPLIYDPGARKRRESWQSLVHVCQRWRELVFGSPCRLDLQLYCTPGTSAMISSDVWPALPLLIRDDVTETSLGDIIAEFEHSDRIRQVNLDCRSTPQIEKLWTSMRVPFPELEVLSLRSDSRSYMPVLPDSLLAGSAPRLRTLHLDNIPFLGLPKLLLSASHLMILWLIDIPHSCYISPEAMASCLSTLTSLYTLQLVFDSPQSSPEQENRHDPPPPTRFVLPALESFWFKGVTEYLEGLVARIDSPRLSRLSATYFHDLDFHTPELIRFVGRSPILEAPKEAHVFFGDQVASVRLRTPASKARSFYINVLCREPGWQLSSLVPICTTSLPLLSTTENLFICEQVGLQSEWKGGFDEVEWSELLLPFTTVKNLYLSKQFAPRVAPALQVLSALQNLYLEELQPSESVQECIQRYLSTRQPTDHPVTISVWEKPLSY